MSAVPMPWPTSPPTRGSAAWPHASCSPPTPRSPPPTPCTSCAGRRCIPPVGASRRGRRTRGGTGFSRSVCPTAPPRSGRARASAPHLRRLRSHHERASPRRDLGERRVSDVEDGPAVKARRRRLGYHELHDHAVGDRAGDDGPPLGGREKLREHVIRTAG